MTVNKQRAVSAKSPSKTGNAKRRPATVHANVISPRNRFGNVSQTSGKVISQTVATHRDALKRLADR